MKTLIFLALSVALAWGQQLPPAQDALAHRVLASTLAAQYPLAAQQADSMWRLDRDAGTFFRTMVMLSRYDDLGDTLDLFRAQAFLDTVQVRAQFWECLRLFQLGFVRSELHANMSAALATRKAAKGFQEFDLLEARAFYAIYGYYMEGATAWVPFSTDKRAQMLSTLDSASLGTSVYWPVFSTSLAWMRFDRKEYAQGLAIAERSLARAPGHAVFTQLRGDMLYRLGKYAEAAKVYEQSAETYAVRAPNSVRWWSAAGNLVRIYHALGDKARMAAWQARFREPRFQAVKPWMPASLMQALDDDGLLSE